MQYTVGITSPAAHRLVRTSALLSLDYLERGSTSDRLEALTTDSRPRDGKMPVAES